MQLIHPGALLVLGLIPILVLIHSLRPKPREVDVTSLFLWQEALREKKGGAFIKRFVKNLPLLLQILAVVLATVALAEPVWFYTPPVKGNVILVLDSSASMKTRTGQGIRFDLARKEAFRLIDDLPKESRVLIIQAGHNPSILSPFSNDKSQLRQIIADARPSDTRGRIDKAVYLALSFMDPDRDDRIFLVTDGAGGQLEKISRIHQRVRTILVPGGTKNVGITKFEFRRDLEFRDHYEIMLVLKNYNPHPVLCPIELTLEDKTIVEKTIGLRALEKKLLVFPHTGPLSGRAEATLKLDDDFPIDNRAYTVLHPSRDIWILLVTKGNYFLERLLAAYPNVMINSVKEIIPSSWTDQAVRHDIVILDRIPPPATERGNFVLIDALSPSIPLLKTGHISNPEILDWDRRDPIMANLDLSGLYIERATQVKAAARAGADNSLRPILESQQTGLMFAYEKSGLRAVYVGFDPTRSDLPLRVAYPVLMSNIFDWLVPHHLRFSTSQVKAGEPFPIYVGPRTENFSVATPSGKWYRYPFQSNPFEYVNTREVGIYTVEEGEKWRYFAVNLVDESESDIRVPVIEPPARERPEPSKAEPVAAEMDLWVFFVISVLLVLVLEWFFWLKSR